MDKKLNRDTYSTKEYEKFRFTNWNRKTSKKDVYRLAKSISTNGYIGSPIVVNEKYEIIDGQHRFLACKEIGCEIEYQIKKGFGQKEAMVLNADQSKWKLQDYIMSYSSENVDDEIRINYQRLKDLMVEYGQILDVTLCACYGNAIGRGTNSIQDGTLRITLDDYERARSNLEFINRFSEYITFFGGNKRTTLCTLIKLKYYNLIDEDRMVEQFEKYGNRYISANDIASTLESLDEIYNTNRKVKEHFVDKFKSIIGE